MKEVTPRMLFLESVERCATSTGFITVFYERFVASSEIIREKFAHTDFARQNQMLLDSLRLVAGATEGDPRSLREIAARAETHSRRHLDIAPELYEFWRDALMETAAEFDDEWNEATREAWHSTLGHVIKRMIRSY